MLPKTLHPFVTVKSYKVTFKVRSEVEDDEVAIIVFVFEFSHDVLSLIKVYTFSSCFQFSSVVFSLPSCHHPDGVPVTCHH